MFGRPFNYHSYVGLQAGRSRLKLNEYVYKREENLIRTKIGKAEVEQSALKEAIETAEKLQDLGLEATINGGPIDKAREAIAQCAESIKKIKRGYADYL